MKQLMELGFYCSLIDDKLQVRGELDEICVT